MGGLPQRGVHSSRVQVSSRESGVTTSSDPKRHALLVCSNGCPFFKGKPSRVAGRAQDERPHLGEKRVTPLEWVGFWEERCFRLLRSVLPNAPLALGWIPLFREESSYAAGRAPNGRGAPTTARRG